MTVRGRALSVGPMVMWEGCWDCCLDCCRCGHDRDVGVVGVWVSRRRRSLAVGKVRNLAVVVVYREIVVRRMIWIACVGVVLAAGLV